jgi:hypothetical protein
MRFSRRLTLSSAGTLAAWAALAVSVVVVCPRFDSWIVPGTARDYIPIASFFRSLACHGSMLVVPFAALGAVLGDPTPEPRLSTSTAAANPFTMWLAFALIYVTFPRTPYPYVTVATCAAFGVWGTLIGVGSMHAGFWLRTRLAGGGEVASRDARL